jgi:hypothetical protein
MESVTVLQTNPLTFIAEVVEAIEQGYLVESSNRGWVSDSILKQITLYKDADRTTVQKELGEFVIDEWDAQKFLSELCDFVVCGGKVDIESLRWDTTGKKYIEGKMYLIPQWSKEELAEQDWETFKASVKTIGITGRDRSLMTNKYLQMTGQQE